MKIRNRRGSTLLEFALAGSFIFTPLLIGLSTVGMAVLRSMQVVAFNRSAGHMFAMGVDFSQSQNKTMLLKVAGNLNITSNGGTGVLILSEIDGTGNNQAVCVRQIIIGNAAEHTSNYVNPAGNLIDSGGNVNNLNDASANANALTAILPMSQGQVAYVAESYFSTSDYDWTGFLSNTGIYSKAIF